MRPERPKPLPKPERPKPAPRPERPKPPPKPEPRPQPSSPQTPITIAIPKNVNLKQRINRSDQDENMTVIQSPTELLAQARRYDPTITLDELTGARLAASEHGSGSFTELCCIVDSELNRAQRRGKSLYKSLTYKDTFGKQGKTRRASTRRDPRMRHLLAARAVISGKARGISQGATRFYDPKAQLSAYKRWKAGKSNRRHCHPLVILERWAFDLPWAKTKKRCRLNRRKPGRRPQQWVGPIAGVDPIRLMLMGPGGAEHKERYESARRLILDNLINKGKEKHNV